MGTVQKTTKKIATQKIKLVTIESSKSSKIKTLVGDDALLNYLHFAVKGEIKIQSGIKYWFEQNIDGHTSEETFESGRPDGYTPGWLVLELKGKQQDWIEGFFQGLVRKELSFKLLVVACHNTLLVFPGRSYIPEDWSSTKKKNWKELLLDIEKEKGPASTVAKNLVKKFKANRTRYLEFTLFEFFQERDGGFKLQQDPSETIKSFKRLITSHDPSDARIEITPKNFSSILKSLLPYFDKSLNKQFEVVHGFFRCLSYINKSYTPIIPDNPEDEDKIYLGGGVFEGLVSEERASFVEVLNRYEVRRPEKSQFYAHYDKAIDAVAPDYRANHGIYFTNEYLARLAITITENHIGSLGDQYLVFDPACGSGNLVTSWNHHLDLRHKIVSEISPVLLKAFELRFNNSSTEMKKGFTIIPKTTSGEGLNFVSQSADKYLKRINSELEASGHHLNKPLAIVCNPPYKNQKDIKSNFYEYEVDESIVKIVGKDGANELFVCFLAQIAEICRQAEGHELPPNSIVLLFTHTGWLTSKSAYKKIKDYFLERFKFTDGFIANSTEFFDVDQSWPLAVTLWQYNKNHTENKNQKIVLNNLMDLKRSDLKELVGDEHNDFDDLSKWGTDQVFRKRLMKLLDKVSKGDACFNIEVDKIKDHLPPQAGDGNRSMSKEMMENDFFLGGLCFPTEKQFKDREEKYLSTIVPIHEENKKIEAAIKKAKDVKQKNKLKKKKYPSYVVCGHPHGKNIGFTEGKQPYRTDRDFPNDGTHLFFLMDTRFHKMNTSQCLSGVPPKRGHVINNLDDSSKNLIISYSMAHSLAGKVPMNFNQFDMWLPVMTGMQKQVLFEICGALLFSLNSCLECEIPANHPEKESKRAFVTNPLSPSPGTFWTTKLFPLIKNTQINEAKRVIDITNDIYKEWKKFITLNSAYKAKSKHIVYSHKVNKTPLDGWGLYQIEQEIKVSEIEGKISSLFEQRRIAIKDLKNVISDYLEKKLSYWNI